MYGIDPVRLDLAREFRQRPLGPHSPDLQRLLKVLRWDSVTDRFIVVQRVRGGPWSVARVTGPKGSPIEYFDSGSYASSQDAWWEIFRRRWQRHTGVSLELPEDGAGQAPLIETGRLEASASRYPILGYADRFSVRPGETIAFKISASSDYRVGMERLRCGDHAGVGFKSTPMPSVVDGVRSGRPQEAVCGSWVEVPDAASAFDLSSFTLAARIWPTTPGKGRWQALMGNGSMTDRAGYLLGIDADGCLALRLGDGSGETAEVSTGRALLERHWYLAVASFDARTGVLWVCQHALHRYHDRGDSTADAQLATTLRAAGGRGFRIAAAFGARLAQDFGESFGSFRPDALYNGKIDGPVVLSRPLDEQGRRAALAHGTWPGGEAGSNPALIAAWDSARRSRPRESSTGRRIVATAAPSTCPPGP